MRKVLIVFMAAALFLSCNNKKEDNRDRRSKSEKDDYRNSRDNDNNNRDNENNNAGYRDDKNSGDDRNSSYERNRDEERQNQTSSGWSSRQENVFLDDCINEAKKNVGGSRASEYCECMLRKLKRMYNSYEEAEKDLSGAGQDRINRLAEECNQ